MKKGKKSTEILPKLKYRITERKINLLFIFQISYSWQYKTKLENMRFSYFFLVKVIHQNENLGKLMKV